MKIKILAAVALAGILLLIPGCRPALKNENTVLGMTAVEELNYQEALNCFAAALEDKEEEQPVYRGQGIAYLGLSMYPEAIECLEYALSFSGLQPRQIEYDINYYLATAYYKSGDYESAQRIYTNIIALRPKETDAFYLRGITALELGELEAAQQDFERAISLAKGDYDLRITIFCALSGKGYQEAAAQYLEEVLSDENKSISDYDRGRISYYLKDYENARNYLTKAQKNGAQAVLLLGRTYEETEDYNYAASVYSTFIANDQTYPEIYNQLGLCKLELKDYEGALSAFQAGMVIENNGLLQTLKFNEIVAYEYLGDFQRANVLMENYLETYPDDSQALREAEFLKTR